MNDAVPPKRIFPTSKVDAQAASHVPSTPQTASDSYKLAFQDTEFLLREDLRLRRFREVGVEDDDVLLLLAPGGEGLAEGLARGFRHD